MRKKELSKRKSPRC